MFSSLNLQNQIFWKFLCFYTAVAAAVRLWLILDVWNINFRVTAAQYCLFFAYLLFIKMLRFALFSGLIHVFECSLKEFMLAAAKLRPIPPLPQPHPITLKIARRPTIQIGYLVRYLPHVLSYGAFIYKKCMEIMSTHDLHVIMKIVSLDILSFVDHLSFWHYTHLIKIWINWKFCSANLRSYWKIKYLKKLRRRKFC